MLLYTLSLSLHLITCHIIALNVEKPTDTGLALATIDVSAMNGILSTE